jgi:hypothetical protein
MEKPGEEHANVCWWLQWECLSISHAVAIANGHMEKPSEENGIEFFSILEENNHMYHI